MWLERESSVDEVDGSGERPTTTTTPSGSSIRARSTSVSTLRHPTSAVRPTRASLAREKLAGETTRASGAARTAAPLVLSGEALRRATERLHAGAGSGSPRRSAAYVDEECTFTPKIGALSRRMAAEQRRRMGETTNGGAKKKKNTTTTPKEPVGLGGADEAKTQNVAETVPKPVVAVKTKTTKKTNQQKKTDEDEDAKECTFTPRIGRRSRALSEALLKKASMPASFVERSKVWADRKEHILEAEREAKREDEIRDCTFQPQQVTAAAQRVAEDEPNSPANPVVEISGLDAYLARQERARRLRDEKNAILNRFDGASWTPELTVPKEFEFHSVKTRASSESTTSPPESSSPAHERQGGGVSAWRSPAYVEARAKLLHGSTRAAAAAAAYGVAAE